MYIPYNKYIQYIFHIFKIYSIYAIIYNYRNFFERFRDIVGEFFKNYFVKIGVFKLILQGAYLRSRLKITYD